jgi:hypothetical protein
MKSYPSIPSTRNRTTPLGEPCVGFYKYDGSNLRWEWQRKRGYVKFGTRNRLFGADEAPFNEAIPIFNETLGPRIEKIMTDNFKGIMEFVVFTEFWGNKSFAGTHEPDDEKFLTLIDVSVYKKGMLPPRDFVKLFQPLDDSANPHRFPIIVYEGNLNKEIIEQVRSGFILTQNGTPAHWYQDGNPPEGVVFKGANHRGQVWMAKAKTNAYLERLKGKFKQDWEQYAE